MNDGWNNHWPQSTALRALPVREQAKVLMKSVAARFPGTQLPPESVGAFIADWAQLIKRDGTERFLVGVQRACQATSFFPVVADVVKHIPPAPVVSTLWKPTEEDKRRQAAGERNYGTPDVKYLGVLHVKLIEKHKRDGRPVRLSEDELDGLQIQLDLAIDSMERGKDYRNPHKAADVQPPTGRSVPAADPTLFDGGAL